jgi:hypothetical protein
VGEVAEFVMRRRPSLTVRVENDAILVGEGI